MRALGAAALLAALALVQAACGGGAGETLSVPRAREIPKADGTIETGEYTGRHLDPNTGIEVLWAADSTYLYAALRSPGAGWLSIGFGSSGMKGSVMIIALKLEKEGWVVQEHLGKSFHRHAEADKPALLSGTAWQEDGATRMEFALPLKYAEGRSITAGAPTPFILAYHKSKTSPSRHTKRSSGALRLAD